MEKRILAIIQAHMGSSRLPGKIMKDLCGMPALYRMIERVRQSELLDDIVVATSTLPCDDVIIDACNEWGIHTFRGSDNDVLARFGEAAQAYPADIYVRMTSDCPLMDPGWIDKTVRFFLDHSYRYVYIDLERKPNGLGIEPFTAELLKEAVKNATEKCEREHVTPYMYRKQDSIYKIPFERDNANYRITLDTPEDYEVIKRVYEALYQPGNRFTLDEVLDYLDAHPEILEINAMIKQKVVE